MKTLINAVVVLVRAVRGVALDSSWSRIDQRPASRGKRANRLHSEGRDDHPLALRQISVSRTRPDRGLLQQ